MICFYTVESVLQSVTCGGSWKGWFRWSETGGSSSLRHRLGNEEKVLPREEPPRGLIGDSTASRVEFITLCLPK